MSRGINNFLKKIVILSLILAILFLPNVVKAETVNFNPANLTIGQNTNFSLPLYISEAQNVFGIGFDLNYNTNLFDYIGVQEGNFLNQGCMTILMATPSGGRVIFGLTRLGAFCGGVSGSGLVATFNFRSKTTDGTGAFTFANNSVCVLNNGACAYTTGAWTGANVTVFTPDTAPPSVPTGLTADAVSFSQINLTWNASTDNVGVIGYRVYRNGAQISTTTSTSFQNTGLMPSTSYTYTVAAFDAAGNVSAQSAPVSATTNAAPDTTPPIISSVNASGITHNSAVITWATNEPASSRVEYGLTTSYGNLTPLNQNLSTAHSVSISNLLSNRLYNYRVISTDSAGNTGYSSNYTFTTLNQPDTLPPSIPTGLKADFISSSQINLSWNASTDNVGVIGYRVYRNGAQISTTASTSFQNTGLMPSTSYTYTVAAFDAAGNISAQSAPLSVQTKILTNNPPIAGNDNYSTIENIKIAISVADLLGNDHDPDGQSISFYRYFNSINCSVSFAANNDKTKIIVTPRQNFSGQASFKYAIRDIKGAEGTGTVNINVIDNRAPIAVNDSGYRTIENIKLIINVSDLLANDYDPDNQLFSIIKLQESQNGWANFERNSNNSKIIFSPKYKYSGPASFKYIIKDESGATAAATVNINVIANQPPVQIKNQSYQTLQNIAIIIPVEEILSNFKDPEDQPFKLISLHSSNTGTAHYEQESQRTKIIFKPRFNYTGEAFFSYRLKDASGGITIGQTKIIILPNNPPQPAADSFSVPKNIKLFLPASSLLSNDSDLENQKLTIVSVHSAKNGSVSFEKGSQNTRIIFTPRPDFIGQASFKYTVKDESQSLAYGLVNITVR